MSPSCYAPAVQITVVIPALNEAEGIAEAVASARATDVEVIVVDGGSGDATRSRAAHAGARVVEAPVGRACQLRAGARAGSGDIILFLHADSRLPSGFDAAVREAFRSSGVVAGAFRLRFDDRGPGLRIVEWGVRLRVALLGLPYGDQGLFVRRSALEAVGGVPDVAIMEDLDLVKALRERGRLALLKPSVLTSARRYRSRGVMRTVLRNWGAWAAWVLGLDRERIAAWYRR